MSFLTPKVPKPPPAPNTPVQANPGDPATAGIAPAGLSLVSTAANGLQRKASTQRTSLIGGGM